MRWPVPWSASEGPYAAALDACLAAFVTVATIVGTLAFAPESGERVIDTNAVLLLLVAGLSLVFRRHTPTVVAIVTISCAVAYYAASYPGIFADCPAVIAGYTLAAGGRRRAAIVAGLALCVGIVAIGVLPHRDAAGAVTGALWVLGFWVAFVVAGNVSEARTAYFKAAEQRAAEAERTREEAARRRASEERLRIARDLHDSLTHTISVITVQAGVADHLADRDPQRVRDALYVISESGRDAMAELRSTLGVLDDSGTVNVVPSMHRPGLTELPTLIARIEAIGTPVVRHDDLDTANVSPETAAIAYRILQEALTNAARHAPGATAHLRLQISQGQLTIQVSNEASQNHRTLAGGGFRGRGLTSIHERAASLGGHARTARRSDGGFQVEAFLPLLGDGLNHSPTRD